MNFKRLIILTCSLFLTMTVVAFAGDAVGDDNFFDNPKTGPRPGENDPMKPTYNTIFKDDEAMMMVGFPDKHEVAYVTHAASTKDLTDWSLAMSIHQFSSSEFIYQVKDSFQVDYPPPVLASARGRISEHAHDQTAYAFYRPNGQVQVERWNPLLRESTTIQIPGRAAGSLGKGFIDLAVGDLDLMIEDKTYYHDEIVVVRGCGSSDIVFDVCLDVIDYEWNVLVNTLKVPNSKGLKVETASVDIGDLDGDGFMEIVVAQSREFDIVEVTVYGFEREDNGEVKQPHVLQLYSTNYIRYATESDAMDLTVGDFDGDGDDDVAVAFDFFLEIWTAGTDEDHPFALVLKKRTEFENDDSPNDIKLVSGLFRFIPPPTSTWGIRRKQLAIVYSVDRALQCNVFEMQTDFSLRLLSDPYIGAFTVTDKVGTFDVSVGNFVGHLQDNTFPNEQIAVAYEQRRSALYSTAHFAVIEMRTDGTYGQIVHEWAGDEHFMGRGKQLAISVAADDIDGDSYRLGPPAHITVENLLSLDYIIQEPPKHVDYLPLEYDDPEGEWGVFNVSGWEDFDVVLTDEIETSLETDTTNSTSVSFGASVGANSEETIGGGAGDIDEAKVSVDVEAKASYDYENTHTRTEKQYSQTTLEYSCSTAEDDFIKGKVQLIDIWRYPIYGMKTTNVDKPHGFQEIILPGPTFKFEGAGRAHADWYQPIHHNRNLFSYPHLQDTKFPHDLGSFQPAIANDSLTIVMNDMTIHSWGGTDEEWNITWTTEAGEEDEKEYKHSINSSLEITLGMEAKAEIGPFESETKDSVSFGMDAGVSFSSKTMQETTNKSSKGITVNLPAHTDSDISYDYITAGYITDSGGAFKVAHAVQLAVNSLGRAWWKNQYGSKADPALNLPNMFKYTQKTEDPNAMWILEPEEAVRWQMRGLFLRKNTANKVTGKFDPVGPVVDGDLVLVCSRVYNYSLYTDTGPFDVKFEYLPIDNQSGYTADMDRIPIGVASIMNLPGQETAQDVSYQEVCVQWDTTGLSDLVEIRPGGETHYDHYQFYVTVDPDDRVVNEVHELDDGAGTILKHSNNVGHWPWGAGVIVLADNSSTLTSTSIHMPKESLLLKLEEADPLTTGNTYKIRAHVVSSGQHPYPMHVYFFDGHPQTGGKLIGSRVLFSLKKGDNYAWSYWTPRDAGKHVLYAMVLEDSNDTNQDAWDSLTVSVRGGGPFPWQLFIPAITGNGQ